MFRDVNHKLEKISTLDKFQSTKSRGNRTGFKNDYNLYLGGKEQKK